MSDHTDRFNVQDGEIEMVKKSNSGLIVTSDVIARAQARIQAGEDIDVVAFDVATEDVALRSKLDNSD